MSGDGQRCSAAIQLQQQQHCQSLQRHDTCKAVRHDGLASEEHCPDAIICVMRASVVLLTFKLTAPVSIWPLQ